MDCTFTSCDRPQKYPRLGLCKAHGGQHYRGKDLTPLRPRRSVRSRFDTTLRHKYGITQSQYEEMLMTQCSQCAICGDDSDRLRVDHDHATGKVRGLLCHHCNVALGSFKDTPAYLRAAASYLEEQC
jgi:hypothetical protein